MHRSKVLVVGERWKAGGGRMRIKIKMKMKMKMILTTVYRLVGSKGE